MEGDAWHRREPVKQRRGPMKERRGTVKGRRGPVKDLNRKENPLGTRQLKGTPEARQGDL